MVLRVNGELRHLDAAEDRATETNNWSVTLFFKWRIGRRTTRKCSGKEMEN
jgi:hypothetical protein